MSVTFFAAGRFDDMNAPELNVANGNVTTVLDILHFPYTQEDIYSGEIYIADLPRYLKNVFEADLTGMERSSNTVGNMVYCGLGADRIQQYKDNLIKIIGYCIAHNTNLYWS